MTTQEVANRLVELVAQGKYEEAQNELYHNDAVSIEPENAQGPGSVKGLDAIIEKGKGWAEMVEIGVYLTGNPSGSFVYVISLVHALHLIGGLVYITIVFVKTFQLKIHSQNMNTIEMCAVYWHFLDVLWLYLFLFLTLYR
jgi:hypothetical protein